MGTVDEWAKNQNAHWQKVADELKREGTPAEMIARSIDTSRLTFPSVSVKPEAMSAAAHYIDREYGYGYRIGLASWTFSGDGIFSVRHSDGSEFYIVADRYGNVARVEDQAS